MMLRFLVFVSVNICWDRYLSTSIDQNTETSGRAYDDTYQHINNA